MPFDDQVEEEGKKGKIVAVGQGALVDGIKEEICSQGHQQQGDGCGQAMSNKKEGSIEEGETHGGSNNPVPILHGVVPEFIVIHKILRGIVQKSQCYIPVNESGRQVSIRRDHIPLDHSPFTG